MERIQRVRQKDREKDKQTYRLIEIKIDTLDRQMDRYSSTFSDCVIYNNP